MYAVISIASMSNKHVKPIRTTLNLPSSLSISDATGLLVQANGHLQELNLYLRIHTVCDEPAPALQGDSEGFAARKEMFASIGQLLLDSLTERKD